MGFREFTIIFPVVAMSGFTNSQSTDIPICKLPAPRCSLFKRSVCEWSDSGDPVWACRGYFESVTSGVKRSREKHLDSGAEVRFETHSYPLLRSTNVIPKEEPRTEIYTDSLPSGSNSNAQLGTKNDVLKFRTPSNEKNYVSGTETSISGHIESHTSPMSFGMSHDNLDSNVHAETGHKPARKNNSKSKFESDSSILIGAYSPPVPVSTTESFVSESESGGQKSIKKSGSSIRQDIDHIPSSESTLSSNEKSDESLGSYPSGALDQRVETTVFIEPQSSVINEPKRSETKLLATAVQDPHLHDQIGSSSSEYQATTIASDALSTSIAKSDLAGPTFRDDSQSESGVIANGTDKNNQASVIQRPLTPSSTGYVSPQRTYSGSRSIDGKDINAGLLNEPEHFTSAIRQADTAVFPSHRNSVNAAILDHGLRLQHHQTDSRAGTGSGNEVGIFGSPNFRSFGYPYGYTHYQNSEHDSPPSSSQVRGFGNGIYHNDHWPYSPWMPPLYSGMGVEGITPWTNPALNSIAASYQAPSTYSPYFGSRALTADSDSSALSSYYLYNSPWYNAIPPSQYVNSRLFNTLKPAQSFCSL